MKISYNFWKAYKECPKKFDLRYRKISPTVPRNDYFAIYGKLVEKFFEMYCNIWRFKTPYMPPDFIKKKLEFLYENIIASSIVNWNTRYATESRETIFEQALKDIYSIMDSPNQNYFLNTKSEVKINLNLKDNTIISGRLDFIHTDVHNNNIENIFDGKGTNKIGKNIDNNQLLFYALLYFFHFSRLPAEIGFFYYRFNTYIPIEFNKDILNEFRANISLDLKTIKNDMNYIATPSSKSCKYCEYRINCIEQMDYAASRKRPSKITMLDDSITGIQEFSFEEKI